MNVELVKYILSYYIYIKIEKTYFCVKKKFMSITHTSHSYLSMLISSKIVMVAVVVFIVVLVIAVVFERWRTVRQ